MPCANPMPYHPLHEDGTCHYWQHERCTYWINEAWRATCEANGKALEAHFAEQDRRRRLTPEERAEEDGALF